MLNIQFLQFYSGYCAIIDVITDINGNIYGTIKNGLKQFRSKPLFFFCIFFLNSVGVYSLSSFSKPSVLSPQQRWRFTSSLS